MMNKWLMLKLADDFAALSEDLKKAAGEENEVQKEDDQVEAAPQKEEEQKEEKVPEKEYTLTDVRKKLSSLSSDGKTDQVRELLSKYGAKRLSEIKPEDFNALMEEAEKL